MDSTQQGTSSTRPGPPWQFSLRTLLVVTAATAVALAIVVSLPNAAAVPVAICLNIAVPALLTIMVIYGSGYQRTFCIGALFPTGTMLYATGWFFGLSLVESPTPGGMDTLEEWGGFLDVIASPYRPYTGIAWLLAVLIGSLAVWVRWRLEQRARREDQGNSGAAQK